MPSASSPRGWRILRFIKRKPLPVKVVGEGLDGDDITVAITGDNAGAMSDAVSALDGCWTIRALDKEGNTIRKLELDPQDPELAADAPDLGGNNARSNTIISIDVPKLVDSIARNMRELSEGTASQQAKAFSAGFEAMTSVVNLCLQLLVRVERRLEVAEERGDSNTPNDGGRNQLAMLALQNALGGGGNQPQGQPQHAGSNGGIRITPEMINSLLEQFMTPGAASEGDGSNGAG